MKEPDKNQQLVKSEDLTVKQKRARRKLIRRCAEKMLEGKQYEELEYRELCNNIAIFEREVLELLELGFTLEDSRRILSRCYRRGTFHELYD